VAHSKAEKIKVKSR